jgi:hypothetical protein
MHPSYILATQANSIVAADLKKAPNVAACALIFIGNEKYAWAGILSMLDHRRVSATDFRSPRRRHLSSLIVWFMRAKFPVRKTGPLDISAETPEQGHLQRSPGRVAAQDTSRPRNPVHAAAALRQEIEKRPETRCENSMRSFAFGGEGRPNGLIRDEVDR